MSTLIELRAEVREAVMERASDTGLIPSDARLNFWISRANEKLWAMAVAVNPAAWVQRSANGLACTSTGVPFATIAAAGVHQVKAAWRLDSDGLYKFMRSLEEVNEHLIEDEVDRANNDPDYRWYVEGNVVYLTPVPVLQQTVKFKFVGVPAALAADADQPLMGRYPEHHGLVALKTAQLLYRRDEEKDTPWDADVKEGMQSFTRTLQRSQGHSTRRIIRRRAFP